MPNPVTDALVAAVANATTVEASAVAYIQGVPALIQAAIDKAIAGGATAADLAPVQTAVDALTTQAAAITAALTQNTPAARQ